MVTDRLMFTVKSVLTNEPQTLRMLARKLDKDRSQTLIILRAMAKLDICEQVDLPPARGPRQAKKGWKLRG